MFEHTPRSVEPTGVPSAPNIPSFPRIVQKLHADMRGQGAQLLTTNGHAESVPEKIRLEHLKQPLHDELALIIRAVWHCMREHIAEKEAEYGNLGLGIMQSESMLGQLLDTDVASLHQAIRDLPLDDAVRVLKRRTEDAFTHMGWTYISAADIHTETVPEDMLESEEAAFLRYKRLLQESGQQAPYHGPLLRGIKTANYMGWEMARIATHLAQGQKTKHALREILHNSESFLKIFASMHLGIFSLVEKVLMKGDFSDKNREFHECFFTFRTVHGKETLGFSDYGLEVLDTTEINPSRATLCDRTGCPAADAQGEEKDVISEHYHWILDVFERFCPDRHFAHSL